ncbi:hypothetical protein AN478_11250 [Thiohalorhabdus denitrificans]|uniref:Ca2+-binding protein, EF-hand superfamily n=1 Tax=Thiohalorhabdus denitrificans TaxID=381306 RepID=A0A0P9CSL6_9GAMM|nr:hypothetical protein [Thiohalorhabdus denitrificans]KPV39682.1 hypothetical protein AN478_11250 [Thiohalorhabdus denitrificans]SCX94135.1 Ca2+-binding protein, EF-hand superfamily [Thiohalorhabdus denitrificans]
MERKRSLALVVALLVGAYGTALSAGQDIQFERYDRDGDGVISLDEAKAADYEVLSERFEAYDEDGDGALTPGEFARFEETGLLGFDDYDVDGDDNISAAEAEEYGPEELYGNFEEYDLDENQTLDRDEFAQFRDDYAEQVAEGDRIERYDTNGDGVVSMEEAQEGPALLSERFEEYDVDGDGNLDEGEFARFEADHGGDMERKRERQTNGMD